MHQFLTTALALILLTSTTHAQNWSQGPGPNANFTSPHASPTTSFSVALNQNIAWSKPLPESGQSTVTTWGDKLFYTTNKPVTQDSELGADIIAFCADAKTGDVLWQRDIPADHPLRLSGCFADASAPPAVTDGKRVCFFNAAGTIRCFDMNGKQLWTANKMPVGRTQPFLVNGAVVYTRQKYMPVEGKFTHENGDLPPNMWTNLEAINLKTGKVTWASTCGVNMGCSPLLQTRGDGKQVIMVGRGGGHNPPENPEGVSLVDATNGQTLWSLPLQGFMSTMTFSIRNNNAYVFHANEHLAINATTGEITHRTNFLENVTVRRHIKNKWTTTTETLPGASKGRAITQGSNLLVGNYHYFRSYTHNYLGRIHLPTHRVEFLQLPTQALRTPGQKEKLFWDVSDFTTPPQTKKGKAPNVNSFTFIQNDMLNNNGHLVMGDARSHFNGWGHYAAQAPTAIGPYLYIPTLNGTVYTLRHSADRLNENALVAINDLGPAGKSYNRASLSYANGALYAHTMNHLIKIQTTPSE